MNFAISMIVMYKMIDNVRVCVLEWFAISEETVCTSTSIVLQTLNFQTQFPHL